MMARREGGTQGIGGKVNRVRRDWTAARAKVEGEGRCRACREPRLDLEAAHVIGREHDFERPIRWPSDVAWITRGRVIVAPTRIVPLCPPCHRAQHDDRLTLLGLLDTDEQTQAVADAGGIMNALEQLAPAIWAPPDDPVSPPDDDIPF
jgi:hypothetical protein